MQSVLSRIRLVALYLIILLPFIIFGAVHALQSSNNSPIDWVDSTFPERHHYNEFVELFGPGDVVVMSWPGCYWNDHRLDELASDFQKSKLFQNESGESYFYQVVSGRQALLSMADPDEADSLAATSMNDRPEEGGVNAAETPDEPKFKRSTMPLAMAIKRLQGGLIGQDGRTTCLIVTLNKEGLATRSAIVKNLREAICRCCEVNEADIHMAGPVIDGLTVDDASHRSLTNFAAPSAIVIFLICWWSLGSVVSGAVVFLTAAFCQAALLAIIYYSGQRLSALLIILPPLVQVLTVSGGIHLMNYYLNSLESMSPQQAAIDAFQKGWLPSLLSLGTTAMGTASLMVSGLEPIRLFGIYGTVGVLLTSATVLTVIPCSMILIGKKRNVATQCRERIASSGDLNTGIHFESSGDPEPRNSGVWYRLALLLRNYNRLTIVVIVAVMVVSGFGLSGLKTSIRIETLFATDSRIMQDYRWLESHLGPLVPIEVLVKFDSQSKLNDRLRMDVLWKASRAVEQHPDVHSTFSALTAFPPLPGMKSMPSNLRSAMLNKSISMARPAFEQMGVLRKSDKAEVWRITARVSALEPLDYGEILESIRTTIDQKIKTDTTSLNGVTISTSGIMPLVHRIQGQLLSDLFSSLLSALAVITLTMTIVEAGLISGLLSMASNVLPIVVAFGCMGWLSRPMDIGSVMTASVALGIAVDDTLHFLAFFRRVISRPGQTRFSAVVTAYQHCGLAMIQTSVSCGLGLLVFGFSEFVPTSRFAFLMVFLLFLALLGDLLLLPAILLSPAGRYFQASPAADRAAEPS